MSPAESPYLLCAVGAVIAIVAIARVLPRSAKGGLALLAVGGLLVAAAFVVDRQVVTDRERIDASLAEVVAAFAADDAAPIQNAISETAPLWRLAATAAVAAVDLDPDYRLTDVQTTVDGRTASQHFRLNGRIVAGNFDAGRQPTRWRLDWVQEGSGTAVWRIADVHQLDPLTGEEITRARKYLGMK